MVTPTPSALDVEHGNNFDAIRIAAALLVLLSHHFALTGQGEPSFLHLHSVGGAAVIVFFIISGYLVTASWVHDPSVPRFLYRRFLRLWPALALVVVVTAYGLGAWVTRLPLVDYWAHRATFDYLSALWMHVRYVLPGVFEDNPYARGVNGSLWTIPIEVRCYLILAFAGLLGLLRRHWLWLLIIAAYMLWFLLRRSADVTGHVHYRHELTAYFLAGSGLCLLQPSWQRHTVRWLAAMAAVSTLALVYDLYYTTLLVAAPLLVLMAGTAATPVFQRAGHWGDPSYGVYLIAFPVQQTVIHFLWPAAGFAGTLAIAATVTVVLAYGSWHAVEKVALRHKPRKPTRRVHESTSPTV